MYDNYEEILAEKNSAKIIRTGKELLFCENGAKIALGSFIGHTFVLCASVETFGCGIYLLLTMQGSLETKNNLYESKGFKDILFKIVDGEVFENSISGATLGSVKLVLFAGTPFVFGNFTEAVKIEDSVAETAATSFFTVSFDNCLRKTKFYASISGISVCNIFPTNSGAEIVATSLIGGVESGTLYILNGDKLQLKIMTTGSETEFNSALHSGLISGVSASEFEISGTKIQGGTFVISLSENYEVSIYAHTSERFQSTLISDRSIYLSRNSETKLYEMKSGKFVETGERLENCLPWCKN